MIRPDLLMYYFFYFLNIPFKTGRINMWYPNNKYAFVPFFKFKFINKQDFKYYKVLADIINDYNGLVEWELIKIEKSDFYIIKPKILNINETKEFIDKAIDDINNLVMWMSEQFSLR